MGFHNLKQGFDNFKIRDLRFLVQIAQSGSISGAAEQLYIAQPSLSRKLRLMEQEMGISLLKRSNSGIELTEEGKIVCQCAQSVLGACREATEKVALLSRPTFQSVRIGFIPDLRSTLYTESIETMQKTCPPGKISLVECYGGKEVIQNLLQHKIDVGYCSKLYVEGKAELCYRELERIRCHAVIQASFVRRGTNELSLSVIGNQRIFLPSKVQYSALVKLMERILQQAGLLAQVEYIDDMNKLLFLVRCGQGIGFIASGVDLINDTTLVSLPLKEDTIPRYRVIVWRKEDTNVGIMRFLEVVEAKWSHALL